MKDWIERLRGTGRPAIPEPELEPAPRPASLPEVLDLPPELREVLLGLEERGQLRRALRMPPARAALASRLSELVDEHGIEAFREALALIDLGHEEAAELQAPPFVAAPAGATTHQAPPAAHAPEPPAPPTIAPLGADAVAQLGDLNVNQWRDVGRYTDGWYSAGPDGRYELFVARANVPPTLLKELSNRGVVLAEARGVKASEAMTFAIQAGSMTFRSVLALDLDRLREVAGAGFADIHTRWDGAAKKYSVTVLRAKAPVERPRKDEVTHEPVG